MLNFYRRLAAKLQRLRVVLIMFAGVTLSGFLYILFWGNSLGAEQWLLPLLVTFIFLLCLLLMIAFFSNAEKPQRGPIRRFFHWLGQWLLSLALTAMLIFWFFLFLRALSGIIRLLLAV